MQTVGRTEWKQSSANSKVHQFCSVAVDFELSVKCRVKVGEYSLYRPAVNAAQLHVYVQIQPKNVPCCVTISRRCYVMFQQKMLAMRLQL